MMRRRLLLIDSKPLNYITDGLVLWLDGLNRGNTPGIWEELISHNNCELQGSYTENQNNVYFPGNTSTYGIFENQILIPQDEGTIEIACTMAVKQTTGRSIVTFQNGYMGGSIASDGGSTNCPYMRWACFGTAGKYWRFTRINSSNQLTYSASASSVRGVCNGTLGDLQDVTAWNAGTVKLLGWRGSGGNAFYGSIYSIRLYNRILSYDEVIHNQKVDNRRFDLGLNI